MTEADAIRVHMVPVYWPSLVFIEVKYESTNQSRVVLLCGRKWNGPQVTNQQSLKIKGLPDSEFLWVSSEPSAGVTQQAIFYTLRRLTFPP